MADEAISQLTLYATYHPADEIEILDVSDTTFASTGTNKRIQFSTLLTMAGVGSVAGGGTGLTAAGAADQLLGVQHTGGGLEYKTLTAGTNITSTPAAGSITIASTASGGGLTSVGLSTPSWLTVSNSPLTTNGTLAVSATTGETANQVLATPNGSSGALGLRSIVAADLPTVPTSGGGTGLTSIGTADQVLGVAHTGGALEYKTLNAGANITITDAAGQITIASSGTGGGTVSSVGLSTPSWLTVTGSPITGSGTLAVTTTTGVTANQVLATPNGSSGALAVRALAAADIPTLPASQITAPGSSGQLIYNSSNVFTGAADWSIGSSGQLTGKAISDPGTPNAGDLWISSASGNLKSLTAGLPAPYGGIIWQGLSPGTAVTNSTSLLSVLTGISTTQGSLTIPANSLQVGKVIRITLFGTAGVTGTPTLTVQVLLGGNIIAQGTTAALSAASNVAWAIHPFLGGAYQVQAIGSTGKIIGIQRFDIVALSAANLTASGGGAAPSQVTINTTGSLALDVKMQWSVQSTSNTAQFLGGFVTIDG
ncbi:MAG: hypothetical protein ACLP53_21760 [Isosphaeraceae bacterium]